MKFEELYRLVAEQSTLVSDAEKMGKNIFNSAYQDWQERQKKKASGIPYETYGDLWIRPMLNGKLLSIEEMKKFDVNLDGGQLRKPIEVYEGQKNPDILPTIIVSAVFMSNQVPKVTIESTKYKIQEPIPIRVQDTKEEINVPVILK